MDIKKIRKMKEENLSELFQIGNQDEVEAEIEREDVQFVKNYRFIGPTYSKRWSSDENFAYIDYLRQHYQEMSNGQNRRQRKTFKKMSQFLNSRRTPEQCRCHHKKLLSRYSSISQIINVFSLKLNKEIISNSDEPSRPHNNSQTSETGVNCQSIEKNEKNAQPQEQITSNIVELGKEDEMSDEWGMFRHDIDQIQGIYGRELWCDYLNF